MKTLVIEGKDARNGNAKAKTETAKAEPKKEGVITLNSENKEEPKEVTPADEVKKDAIARNIEKFKPEPILTADGRIQKMEEFAELSKRFNILKTKSNDLKKFIAGNDKIGAKITFKNSQGFEFEVQNSDVVKTLSEAAQNELSILLNEAENEVLTFDI